MHRRGGGIDAVLLETDDLTRSFGGIRAVDHLAMTIARGELRCLIGPNGAGKATVFSLLTGRHKPDAGRVLFKGEDITYLAPVLIVRRGPSLKVQDAPIYRE